MEKVIHLDAPTSSTIHARIFKALQRHEYSLLVLVQLLLAQFKCKKLTVNWCKPLELQRPSQILHAEVAGTNIAMSRQVCRPQLMAQKQCSAAQLKTI